MSALASVRGLKRICVACGMSFYDMNKRPIICPTCQVEFTGQPIIKSRKAADKDEISQDTPVEAVNDDDIELEDAGLEETEELNLEDVATMEQGGDDIDGDTPDIDLEGGMGDLDDVNVDGVEDLDDTVDGLDEEEEDEA